MGHERCLVPRMRLDLYGEPSVTGTMSQPPAMIDAYTADRLLSLLMSAMTVLVENSDIWLTEPLPGERSKAEARFIQAEALGEDIAALARAGRVVLRNRAAVEGRADSL